MTGLRYVYFSPTLASFLDHSLLYRMSFETADEFSLNLSYYGDKLKS